MKVRAYLQARYDDLAPRLTEPKLRGLLVTCPTCRFDSCVLASTEIIADSDCEVCDTNAEVARFDCGYRVPLRDLSATCACGETHSLTELADIIDPVPALSPKEMVSYEANRAYCG